MEWLLLVVGWFMGIAQSVVVGRQQEKRQRERFLSGLHIELCGLQAKMAILYWNLSERAGLITRDDVEWVMSRMRRGAADDDEGAGSFRANFAKARDFSDQDFEALRRVSAQRRQQFAVSIRTLDLPFLEAHLTELGGLAEVKTVVGILNVRNQLKFHNDIVGEAERFHLMTFDESVTGGNREKVLQVIEDRYLRLRDRAKWLADSIERCLVALGYGEQGLTASRSDLSLPRRDRA